MAPLARQVFGHRHVSCAMALPVPVWPHVKRRLAPEDRRTLRHVVERDRLREGQLDGH
jgi:hypothetical protein